MDNATRYPRTDDHGIMDPVCRAFRALTEAVDAHPELLQMFRVDLSTDLRQLMGDFVGIPKAHAFLWILRECGTNMIPLYPMSSETWEGRNALLDFHEGADAKIFHYDGEYLRPVEWYEASRILLNQNMDR